ncbi:MAG: hypothetical protein U9O82_00940 [Thermodesulfobacteriota bacterium]|nr:hypothetical protein [Thermodesulfobacteriota bacterium]
MTHDLKSYMNDLRQILENLDPDARECVEGILERMAMAKIRKNTGKIIFEMLFDLGIVTDSRWKDQVAKKRRVVRSRGL